MDRYVGRATIFGKLSVGPDFAFHRKLGQSNSHLSRSETNSAKFAAALFKGDDSSKFDAFCGEYSSKTMKLA
jgi:hypothetical protein